MERVAGHSAATCKGALGGGLCLNRMRQNALRFSRWTVRGVVYLISRRTGVSIDLLRSSRPLAQDVGVLDQRDPQGDTQVATPLGVLLAGKRRSFERVVGVFLHGALLRRAIRRALRARRQAQALSPTAGQPACDRALVRTALGAFDVEQRNRHPSAGHGLTHCSSSREAECPIQPESRPAWLRAARKARAQYLEPTGFAVGFHWCVWAYRVR